MATAVRELNHQRGAVYGNLAYDLDREVRESELRHAGEARRETASKPQVRSISKPLTRRRQKVSIVSILGFAAVEVMAILVLFSYVELTRLSADVVELKDQLSTLETDYVTLSTQYQRMYDLSAVKEVAEAAGMTKPRSSQVYYVDLSGGDSAVVYQQEDPSVLSRLLTSLNHGIYTVVEYFE